MNRLFSSTFSELSDEGTSADIRLLQDSELMGIWEQTQYAAAIIEGKGGCAGNARIYETAVLIEMQRRLGTLGKGRVFGASEKNPASENTPMPEVVILRV